MLDVVLNSNRLTIDDLYTQLKRIVKQAEEEEEISKQEKIGILTAADRTKWAQARTKLVEGLFIGRHYFNRYMFICNLNSTNYCLMLHSYSYS